MLEELEIHDLGPIHRALLTPAGGMTAITGETGAGKSMLLSAIRLISGGPASSGRVSPGASEAWAQGVFAVDDRGGVAQEARDAGAVLEDGELYLSRTVPVSGRSRAVLNGKSAPRSVLESLASQLVTIHGQADQLRIAAASRQREFLDMVAGDDDLLARYRHSWDALRDLDDRLERLRHQESSARQRADYLRESIQRINRADPQPGEDEELKGRRARIENAADIAQGVSRALAALDASQVDVDADSSSASDLLNQAISSLRDVRVDGDFGELADRLESLNADLSDIVFSLSRELDGEESVEDLDAINARIHELGELTRRWGPTLQDVIAWRDKATFEVEDLDASPEKVAQLQDEREAAFDRALQDAGALSEARRAAAQSLAATVTDELSSLAMAGALCLWSGVLEVMARSGMADGLSRLLRPVLRRLLPRAGDDSETLAALSANVSANLLGLGNAATPAGIRAAQRMAQGCGGVASDELCRLVVLNTASIQLLPSTVAAIRAGLGCAAPLDILPAVWLSSAVSVTAGLLCAGLLQRLGRA